MTEYDYSPDAYDRYYAKLNSVARWVDKQADEAYRYTNPFLDAPSVAGSSSGSGSGTGYSSGGLREREARERSSATPPRSVSTPPVKHHSRSHSHHVSSQPPPPLPTQHPQQHPYSQPQAQRQITSHRPSASSTALVIAPAARYAQAQPQQQTHSRSLSSSVPRPHTSHASRSYSQQHQQQPQQRPQAYAYASQSQAHLPQLSTTTKHATRGSTSTGATTTQYTAAPGQSIVMTHGQRTYVVVQPTGGRVEVVVSISFHFFPSVDIDISTDVTDLRSVCLLYFLLHLPASKHQTDLAFLSFFYCFSFFSSWNMKILFCVELQKNCKKLRLPRMSCVTSISSSPLARLRTLAAYVL